MKSSRDTNRVGRDPASIAHSLRVAAQDDPTKDCIDEIEEVVLRHVPLWHVAFRGGPHVTNEALERVEADALYFERGRDGG